MSCYLSWRDVNKFLLSINRIPKTYFHWSLSQWISELPSVSQTNMGGSKTVTSLNGHLSMSDHDAKQNTVVPPFTACKQLHVPPESLFVCPNCFCNFGVVPYESCIFLNLVSFLKLWISLFSTEGNVPTRMKQILSIHW